MQCLGERAVRDVALELIALSRSEDPFDGLTAFCSSFTTDDLPIPEYPETNTSSESAIGGDMLECREQRLDALLAPVQLLGNSQDIWDVVRSQGKGLDADGQLIRLQAAS